MSLRPLHDQILVKRLDEETVSKGGIIIPDAAKEKPQRGKVIAVGNGHNHSDGTITPLEVRPGDEILFAKYGGQEIPDGDETLLIMTEEDVLAVVEP